MRLLAVARRSRRCAARPVRSSRRAGAEQSRRLHSHDERPDPLRLERQLARGCVPRRHRRPVIGSCQTIPTAPVPVSGDIVPRSTRWTFPHPSGQRDRCYWVQAVDAVPTTTYSDPVLITYDTPLAVSVTTPTASSTVHGTSVTVSATATDPGGSGIARVDFYAQGSGAPVLIGSDSIGSVNIYSAAWNTTLPSTPADTYSVWAVAVDSLTLQTTSAAIGPACTSTIRTRWCRHRADRVHQRARRERDRERERERRRFGHGERPVLRRRCRPRRAGLAGHRQRGRAVQRHLEHPLSRSIPGRHLHGLGRRHRQRHADDDLDLDHQRTGRQHGTDRVDHCAHRRRAPAWHGQPDGECARRDRCQHGDVRAVLRRGCALDADWHRQRWRALLGQLADGGIERRIQHPRRPLRRPRQPVHLDRGLST